MRELIDDQNLRKYSVTYEQGDTLFLEGDQTTDLYILVSGRIDILKGPKKISELLEPGVLFGEMSFLLGEKRTATLKAANRVEAIKIAGGQVQELLAAVPNFGMELAKTMAKRLQSTTTMAYGLKEFCDQLPDAVMITTDKDQKVLAWNAAAEKLYGRNAEGMRNVPLKEIYSDPTAYQDLQNSLREGKAAGSPQEMRVHLPDGHDRFVSTSTTMLYDGHYNVQGLLFLGRDVTKLHELESKYRVIRNWLIPSLCFLGLLLALFFYALPSFTRATQMLDYKQSAFREHLKGDYASLHRAISDRRNANMTLSQTLADYFSRENPAAFGIRGVLLLDRDKTVIAAHLPQARKVDKEEILGSSYAALSLSDKPKTPVSLLTLFRSTPENPMGEQTYELARWMPGNGSISWLVFQLDMDWLDKEFGIDPETLNDMRFTD